MQEQFSGRAEVTGLELFVYHAKHETVVHMLYDTVNYIGKLTFFVQLSQLVKVFSVPVILQCVLDIPTNSCIDILSCAFIISECDFIKRYLWIIERCILHFQGTAILNIAVHRGEFKQSRIFSERDE